MKEKKVKWSKITSINVDYGDGSMSHFILPLNEMAKEMLIEIIDSGDFKKIKIEKAIVYDPQLKT